MSGFWDWLFGRKAEAAPANPVLASPPARSEPASPGPPAATAPPIPVAAVGDAWPLAVPAAALALIHHYESCRLAPYLDVANVPTIGWGNTFYADGRRVALTDRPITQAEADALFTVIMARDFLPGVVKALPPDVRTQHFAAFLSLAWNIGVKGFTGSTAQRRYLAGDLAGAAAGIELWNKAGGRVVKGLQRRRRAERLVFEGAITRDAIAAAERAFP